MLLLLGLVLLLAYDMLGLAGAGVLTGEGVGAGFGALAAAWVAFADAMDAMLRQLRLWAPVMLALAGTLLLLLLVLPGRVGSGTGMCMGGGIGVVTGMGPRVGLLTGLALAASVAADAASEAELRQLRLCASLPTS